MKNCLLLFVLLVSCAGFCGTNALQKAPIETSSLIRTKADPPFCTPPFTVPLPSPGKALPICPLHVSR